MIRFAFTALAVAVAMPAQAELLTNGKFQQGLVGWIPTVTVNGISDEAQTGPVTFDVTGNGAQTALRLRVGQVVFPGFGGTPAGAGAAQAVNVTTAGRYRFSADWAASTLGGAGNRSGGIFSLVLNGADVAVFDTGDVGTDTVERGSLSTIVRLSAGVNLAGVQAVRPFEPSDNARQYFTNVSLAAVVPEPAT